MASEVRAIDEATYAANEARLQEIALHNLGSKTDEEVLDVLAERRRIQKENTAFESAREKREKEVTELTGKRDRILKKIQDLNESIAPEKADEELLTLVKKRRKLEDELMAVEQELSGTGEPIAPSGETAEVTDTPVAQEEQPTPPAETVPESVSPVVETDSLDEPAPPVATPESVPEPTPELKTGTDDSFGELKIDSAAGSTEAADFLRELERSPDEAIAKLEDLPLELRKSKTFMLAVAKVDPAYAMHYADAKTLKRDEDFNIHIAGMENTRNSGNPLAEMLPDMRTPNVVMAAVKQDFRNLRYATPSMERYDEMIAVAKKQALEKVKELGKATDVRPLLPKVLREDAEFMERVEDMLKESGGK